MQLHHAQRWGENSQPQKHSKGWGHVKSSLIGQSVNTEMTDDNSEGLGGSERYSLDLSEPHQRTVL